MLFRSKNCHNDCHNDRRNDCKPEPCRKEIKDNKHCPTIIKCGSVGSSAFPEIDIADLTGRTVNLSSVTVDTSCLCNPITKLDFSSNISALASVAANVIFQVYKLCRGQLTPLPVGSAYIFSRLASAGEANTFSFSICDCNSCFDECCTYTITATVTGALDIGLNINNAQLIATSTCGSNNCC